MQPTLILFVLYVVLCPTVIAYISPWRVPTRSLLLFPSSSTTLNAAPIIGQLKEDMKDAMKAKQKERLKAVKAIQAAIKQVEIDSQKEATEDDIIGIMSKLVKKGKESIESYKNAGRDDLVEAEQQEVGMSPLVS